jgi:hypothetical protein
MSLLKRSMVVLALGLALSAQAAGTGKVIKVLPHFLDKKGRHTVSPSLYERDAHQAQLRKSPGLRSGIQFDVQWKAAKADKSNLKLKLEVRTSKGDLAKPTVLEQTVKPDGWMTTWTTLKVDGDAYEKFGDVIAWRATLWEGDQQIAETKSFLW